MFFSRCQPTPIERLRLETLKSSDNLSVLIMIYAMPKKKFFAVLLLVAATLVSPVRHAVAKEPATPLDLAHQLNDAFVEVADRVSKSVVVIQVAYTRESRERITTEENPWLDKLPDSLKKYFSPDESEEPAPERTPTGREPEFQGSGSGIILREDGFILTNHHVVDGASRIKVRLKDGREFDAVVQGTDELSEVAVIKISDSSVKDLPAATFADSDKVRVGEFAIAIGTPYALDYSVTIGHVSAKGRGAVVPGYMGGNSMDQNFIQTDANINPGNSGGPLVNLDGQVMGINTLIKGIGTGIGFAIPSNLARKVSDQLIETGSFERAWLGIEIMNLKDFPNAELVAPGRSQGMVVMRIPPGAPAFSSDLKASDVIIAVNGVPVTNISELRNEVRAQPLGSTLKLDIVRGKNEVTIDVKTGALSQSAFARNSGLRRQPVPEPKLVPLGITVEEIGSDAASQYHVEETKGVVVTAIEPNSPAAAQGIALGAVITDINHQPVKSVKDYQRIVGAADLSKGVLINFVDAAGNSSFEVIKE
jgi:serine protease Do